MITKQLIEKYEGYLVSNPEFEPLLKEIIADLKKINEPITGQSIPKGAIDPELL